MKIDPLKQAKQWLISILSCGFAVIGLILILISIGIENPTQYFAVFVCGILFIVLALFTYERGRKL